MGWEVDDEVEPIALHLNLWELLLRCLYCYAMFVDVDWVLRVSMTNVRLLINGST